MDRPNAGFIPLKTVPWEGLTGCAFVVEQSAKVVFCLGSVNGVSVAEPM